MRWLAALGIALAGVVSACRPALVESPPAHVSLDTPVRTEGCPPAMARIAAPGVDACVDLHEAPGFGELPVEFAIDEARVHCESAGKRLCSEREWETACRGEAGYRFPYGDEFIPTACATGGVPLRGAGTANSCRSPFGTYDMSGNAAEWVESGALKGGDHEGDAFGVRCGARAFPSDEQSPRVRGVRCCATPR